MPRPKKIKREVRDFLQSLEERDIENKNDERARAVDFAPVASEIHFHENSSGSDVDEEILEIDNGDNSCNSDSRANSFQTETNNNFFADLRSWAIKNKITNVAMKELLELISTKIPNLPKDPRTLKMTPREIVHVPLGTGTFFHYFLKDALTDFLLRYKYDQNEIVLDFNIDGW